MGFQVNSDGVYHLDEWEDLPWLVHGFTTRPTGDYSYGAPEGEKRARLGGEGMGMAFVRQVHSDRVRLLKDDEDCWDVEERPEADALITTKKGCLLAVRTADCVPLLIVDRQRRAVAAVHAGWRGTVAQVTSRAVDTLTKDLASTPEDLEVAIGPGIESCCFEVGPEVAEQFDPSVVISPPASFLPGFAGRSLRPHIDLVEANRRQLLDKGVRSQSIWSVRRCTCCDAEEFFSYRRDAGAAGRMLAFVGIKAS